MPLGELAQVEKTCAIGGVGTSLKDMQYWVGSVLYLCVSIALYNLSPHQSLPYHPQLLILSRKCFSLVRFKMQHKTKRLAPLGELTKVEKTCAIGGVGTSRIDLRYRIYE